MDNFDLENMWKEQSRKMEQAQILNQQAWVLSLQTFEHLQVHKAKNKLYPLAALKSIGVILGLGWAGFLGALVYEVGTRDIWFSLSAFMIMLFTLLAMAVYIRHIILIGQINYSESITDAQQKLAELQASTVQVARVLWLQMPFYTTWFWSNDLITHHTTGFMLIALPVTLAFTFLAMWLYRSISPENVDKKWIRILVGDKEWGAVAKAMGYLKEIEEFKKG